MLFILKAFQFPLPYSTELGHSRAHGIYLLCFNEPYYTIKTKVLGENGVDGIGFDANGFLKRRASSASHGKKVSSPYTRYACGTFLPNSLNLLRLFSKRLILYNRKDAKSAKDFFNFL